MSWMDETYQDKLGHIIDNDGKYIYVPSDGRVATDKDGKTVIVDERGNKIG